VELPDGRRGLVLTPSGGYAEKVAVLDGTAHAPGQPWKHGKQTISTLWGELAWQLGKALWQSDKLNLARFDSLQPRYNLLDRDVESSILPYCERQQIGVLAHSPLAKGLLTMRYRPGHVFPADDERSQMPRFQGDAFRRLTVQATALNA